MKLYNCSKFRCTRFKLTGESYTLPNCYTYDQVSIKHANGTIDNMAYP